MIIVALVGAGVICILLGMAIHAIIQYYDNGPKW